MCPAAEDKQTGPEHRVAGVVATKLDADRSPSKTLMAAAGLTTFGDAGTLAAFGFLPADFTITIAARA